MSTLRYIFYGGVEGFWQNQNISDLSLIDPAYGANVGGYKEGQLVTGYLTLSGEALQIAQSAPPGTQFNLPNGTPGIDFFFEQPRVGDYTGEDIVGNITMTLGGAGQPLPSLRLGVHDGADGPNVLITSAGANITDDNEGWAMVDGIWLPENVTPLVLSGTGGDNTLRGTAQYNFLSGGNGGDTLFLKAGQGWIWGGNGNDYIKGGAENDFLFGGYGNDKVLGRGGDDLIRGGDGRDDLRGEQGDDFILGGTGNDSVKGGSGNDDLQGQTGRDRIFGNDGADTIRGGLDSDTIDAGSGNDLIFDGAGNDVLKGGPGEDEFSFSFVRGGGHDRVTDFRQGEDTIIIEAAFYESFEEMIAENHAVQSGDDVVITYGTGSTITIEDMRLARLRADDFGFSSPG